MPQGPAARVTDPVAHPLPPILTGGPGSIDVMIGMLPAWRGVPMAAATALQAAKQISDQTIEVAKAATLAAAGTPGLPVAKAAEETVKSTAAATMGAMISGMSVGADKHICATPLPLPPHGPGVVIDGSQTVLINNMPSCRLGDTIIEAVGPPNKIAMGCPTVIIGDSGSGNSGGAMVQAKVAGALLAPSECPLNQGNWWNRNVENPVADASDNASKSIPKGFLHDLYGGVVGVGQGGYEFGKGMVTGVYKLATDRKTQTAVWNLAKQATEDSVALQFGTPQQKLEIAKKYVDMGYKTGANMVKETQEGYAQAVKEGNEAQYVSKTVTRLGLEIGTLFLGGAGAAGKVAEAGNLAEKVGEGANLASKAEKAADAAKVVEKAETLAESGRVLDKHCTACEEAAKETAAREKQLAEAAPKELPPLRQAYIKEVESLKGKASELSASGKTPEEVARTLHQARRDLGIKYKDLTPPDELAKIHARNLKRYGDKLGPSIDYLRGNGKSWEDIIESATRPGGADLGLAKPK